MDSGLFVSILGFGAGVFLVVFSVDFVVRFIKGVS